MVAYDRATQLEWRKKYAHALEEHLKTKNWEKVKDVLPAAEEIRVNKRLLKKSWFKLAEHESSTGHPISAIEHYGSARNCDLTDVSLLAKIAVQLERFVVEFEDRFSREDIIGLLEPLERMRSFHGVQLKQPIPPELDTLSTKLKRLLQSAPSKKETPATPYILRIFAALYSDKMTTEEVQAEFARIVVPIIREEYEKRLKEKNSQKKKPKKRLAPPKPPKNNGGPENDAPKAK
jgi:hypothetical protein